MIPHKPSIFGLCFTFSVRAVATAWFWDFVKDFPIQYLKWLWPTPPLVRNPQNGNSYVWSKEVWTNNFKALGLYSFLNGYWDYFCRNIFLSNVGILYFKISIRMSGCSTIYLAFLHVDDKLRNISLRERKEKMIWWI